MNNPGSAPVMTDVARLAGVSHQTVSRVLNDSPSVSAPTREKVLAAMEELGYRRNAAARALVTRRSGTVGVLTFDTVLHGPVSTLYAVEQAAGAVGLGVTIAVVDRADGADVTRALDRLHHQDVEGVIALAPWRSAVRAVSERPQSVPTVFVGGVLGGGRHEDGRSDLPAIGIDQYGGAVAAVRHLLERGHRTVHHLAGPQDWLDALRRRQGWRDTLEEAGIAVPEPVVGDWSARSGYAAGGRLAADPDLTALFVANDQMALGALNALAEAGRRVPEDVAVVGFDDVPEAEFYAPPLTTVSQGFGEAGRRAVHLLLDRIRPGDEHDAGADPLVPTRLVVRRSSGARPSGALDREDPRSAL